MALMPTYPNGRVPANKLVVFNKGVDKYGRYYEWRLPPSTNRKRLALVARAFGRTGRTLRPSEGWSCDRPYAEQVFARSIHGIFAAKPGTSSHGGCWAGPPTGWRIVDTAAIDYHNWAWVYENHGGVDAFFADQRAVGLTPGGIMPPAFPREEWHSIDLNPWAPVPADDDSQPFPTEAPLEKRDISMRTIYDTENTNEEARRAGVGELSFEVHGPDASARERKLWGDPEAVTHSEWLGVLASVNKRRKQNGLPPLKGVRGE